MSKTINFHLSKITIDVPVSHDARSVAEAIAKVLLAETGGFVSTLYAVPGEVRFTLSVENRGDFEADCKRAREAVFVALNGPAHL